MLARGLLNFSGLAVTDQTVMGLELLQAVDRVIDEGETGGLSSSEVGAETEDGNGILLGFVGRSELGAEVVLGDVCQGNRSV